MPLTNFPHGLTAFGAPLLPAYGIPFGPDSTAFFVDPDNGNDGHDGLTPAHAKKTLAAAYALTTADKHDVVFFLGTDSSDAPTSAIAWANDFTHLIGVATPHLPGMGQRNRLVGSAANDLTQIVTFSGKGCTVANMQFFQGADADVDSGAVIVSGDRNEFVNCFFAGMGHATPAARAGSYSLNVSGDENVFIDCTIGLNTIIRAAANAELILSGTRNTFKHCEFLSYAETLTKVMVSISSGVDRSVTFEACLFFNFWVNWVDQITNCFADSLGSTHYIIFRGVENQLVGIDGWGDTITYMYGIGPAPDAGMGVSTQPTS